MKVLVLHGVNFNMFGYRDPKVYGTITLDEINAEISALAAELDVEVESFQSNHEGDIVEQGNHEDLLAAGGFYANLYNSQFEQSEAG